MSLQKTGEKIINSREEVFASIDMSLFKQVEPEFDSLLDEIVTQNNYKSLSQIIEQEASTDFEGPARTFKV